MLGLFYFSFFTLPRQNTGLYLFLSIHIHWQILMEVTAKPYPLMPTGSTAASTISKWNRFKYLNLCWETNAAVELLEIRYQYNDPTHELWNMECLWYRIYVFFMAIDRDPCESGLVTWLSPIDCDTVLVHVNLQNLAAIFNYQGKYHKSHKQMYQ